jgi:hypothetical protein
MSKPAVFEAADLDKIRRAFLEVSLDIDEKEGALTYTIWP